MSKINTVVVRSLHEIKIYLPLFFAQDSSDMFAIYEPKPRFLERQWLHVIK